MSTRALTVIGIGILIAGIAVLLYFGEADMAERFVGLVVGLVSGGLVAARGKPPKPSDESGHTRLGALALACVVALVLAVVTGCGHSYSGATGHVQSSPYGDRGVQAVMVVEGSEVCTMRVDEGRHRLPASVIREACRDAPDVCREALEGDR